MDEQIDLAEFLIVAERVLGVDAKSLKAAAKLGAAESALAAPFMGFGDTLFYPDPAQRAAIVCSRVIRNHPLPDGNKRTGYLCMLIQLEQSGLTFTHPEGGQDEIADVIEALAASELSEEEFVEWVKARTTA
ncbi:MAG TPA: type II toxin-antitoxin system death-on-curing family toxin [Solirubrobacterales bacterium]|nr:type II toxin-antitoxin system death-on-curing family toxin [Solirubrobacterales bacterium]